MIAKPIGSWRSRWGSYTSSRRLWMAVLRWCWLAATAGARFTYVGRRYPVGTKVQWLWALWKTHCSVISLEHNYRDKSMRYRRGTNSLSRHWPRPPALKPTAELLNWGPNVQKRARNRKPEVGLLRCDNKNDNYNEKGTRAVRVKRFVLPTPNRFCDTRTLLLGTYLPTYR